MAFPSGTYVEQIGDYYTRQELEQFYSLNQGWMSVEHKDTGRHGDVTVDSLELNRDVSTAVASNGLSSRPAGTSSVLQLQNSRIGDTSITIATSHSGASKSASVVMAASSSESSLTLIGDYVQCIAGYRERSRTVEMGEWTAVAHSAGNFTAASGNWTVDSGDQTTYSYALVGKTMTVAFVITASDVSAAAAHLRLAIPGGFTAAADMRNLIQVTDAGTVKTGLARVRSGLAYLEIFPDLSGSAWTITSSDNTSVAGQLTFEVQ